MEKNQVINIKNLTINAENSGTLGRLILGLLVNSQCQLLIGDKSLSKEISEEYQNLSKFGAQFKLRENNFLPLTLYGSSKLKPIRYFEKKVQLNVCSVIFAAMRTNETTIIKAKNQEIIQSCYVNI